MNDPKNILEAINDLDVLNWFEHADLAQAITTHAMASGILRMRERQKEPRGRKKRSDAGAKRKTEEPVLNFDKGDSP